MSGLKGKVGDLQLSWNTLPDSRSGTSEVEVGGKRIRVRWNRDDHGVWLETPEGVFGFDMTMELTDDGARAYQVRERRGGRVWESLSFVRAGEEHLSTSGAGKKKGSRVRAQMPGKIVRILVSAGDQVQKDQPLLVMEAMKMENEIRAIQPGKITTIKVTQGQTVETGSDLMVIE